MATMNPGVGAWFRLSGGAPFEIVAVDDDDGTIEVQYADGTLEELERDDWQAWCDEHALEATDPSEDWSDAADVEADEGRVHCGRYSDGRDLRAGSLDGIDIFDIN